MAQQVYGNETYRPHRLRTLGMVTDSADLELHADPVRLDRVRARQALRRAEWEAAEQEAARQAAEDAAEVQERLTSLLAVGVMVAVVVLAVIWAAGRVS